ncbi:MAG: glycosyltransferase family 2 protein [Acidimicrobiia bacterium]
MTPLVSVVIPTRNRCGVLPRTLRCVMGQSLQDLEVVVVDDASDDATADTLARIADTRLRCERHGSRHGVAAARNTGLAIARGRWVAFVDDDDLWAPQKLALQLHALRSTEAGWSCASSVHVDPALRVLLLQRAPPAGDVVDLVLARNAVPGGASGVVARRDLLLEIGGFDTRLASLADWDLWIRLALASHLAPVAAPVIAYLVHPGALSTDVHASERELEFVAEKYRDERERRGVSLNRLSFAAYFAELQQRSGARLPAARAQLRVATSYRSPRAAAWTLAALAWPGSISLRDRIRRWGLPRAERRYLAQWLHPLRSMSIDWGSTANAVHS